MIYSKFKYIGIFFLVVCLFISLCACQRDINDTPQIDKDVQVSNNSSDKQLESDFNEEKKVVFKTAQSKYSTTNSKIEYTIKNEGNTDIYFSAYSYILEIRNENSWEPVPFDKEYEFLILERVVKPGEEAKDFIELENEFKLPLKKGTYRIVKDEFKSDAFVIE